MTEPLADRAARVAAFACALGGSLQHDQAKKLIAWLDAMLALNQQLNLTAIRDPAQALVLHALDSLAIVRAKLDVRLAVDIGSGNGFPGVAVAAGHADGRVEQLDRRAPRFQKKTGRPEAGPPGNRHSVTCRR